MVNFPGDRARANLLELARQRGVSLSGLSEMIGRNSSYLQQFIRKGSPRKLEEGDRRALARFLGVAEAELGGIEDFSVSEGSGHWVEVPRLDINAAAGSGAVAISEQPFDSFRFSALWLRQHGLSDARLSAIRVQGDSMAPVLLDGDEILVDRGQTALRDGVYVIRLDDVLLVKRLSRAGSGRVTLISDNPTYPPVDVAVTDLEIVGRVVWKSGRL